MTKIGPNERCLCNSGKKYKKCCGDPRVATMYTAEERASALRRLEEWIGAFAEPEALQALAVLWGPFAERFRELPEGARGVCADVAQAWIAFDYIGDRGVPLADAFLAEAELGDGERASLIALCRSSMRLYEVVDVAPGLSLTLRDAIEDDRITIHAPIVSLMLYRQDRVAARIVHRGLSGGPALAPGVLHIPWRVQHGVVERLRAYRARFLSEHPSASIGAFYKQSPPFFHDVWVGAFLAPPAPELQATGGASSAPIG